MEPEVYIRHLKNEESHWWFKGRRKIIHSFLEKNYNFNDKKNNILDFGSGSGTNIDMLSSFGNVYIYEKNKIASDYLKRKYANHKNIKVIDSFENNISFDLIVAADVIEHVENDTLIIEKLSSMLNKNGKLLVTVPAYQFLFSNKDIALHHYRRYTKKSLSMLFKKNYKIIKFSYFNFFLFFPISFSIILMKMFNIQFIDSVEKKPFFLINNLLYYIFFSENYFLKFLNFPFGISIFAFCEKKS